MVWSAPRTWVTAEVVTAAHMNQEVRDNFNAAFPDGVEGVSWTPGLGGTGGGAAVTTVGRRYRDGALQHLWARFDITSDGAGFYFVTLPVPAVGITASAEHGSGQVVGGWTIRDDSGPTSRNGTVLLRAADEVWFNAGPGRVGADFPIVIVPGDSLTFDAHYPYA